MSDNRKILFVGDLRTAYNYGAIATTEALLDLLLVAQPNTDLRLIDSRSFCGNTPLYGWPKVDYMEHLKSGTMRDKSISAIKRMGLYTAAKTIYNMVQKPKSNIDNIPPRYDIYTDAAEKVKSGMMWQYEKKAIEWADIIIINAEGNIVNGTDSNGYYRQGGRYVLFFAYLARCIFNKTCYIINHTVDPKNRDIEKIISEIYPQMDGIYVREKLTYEKLRSWGINNMKYAPDALWTHDFILDPEVKKPNTLEGFDFSMPYICIGDSSGIQNAYSKVKWDVYDVYTRLIKELKSVCPNIIFVDGYNGSNIAINKVIRKNELYSVNLKTCTYHELYFVLSNAKLFISGRWHASIIALLGKTPILLWGSDSHKTEALYREINYLYEFFDVAALPANIDRIVYEAKKVLMDCHESTWKEVDILKEKAKANVDML